jgi:hypothetical protein
MESRRPTVDGQRRQRVRQRALRDLFRDVGVRAAPSSTIPGAPRDLRLHRSPMEARAFTGVRVSGELCAEPEQTPRTQVRDLL